MRRLQISPLHLYKLLPHCFGNWEVWKWFLSTNFNSNLDWTAYFEQCRNDTCTTSV